MSDILRKIGDFSQDQYNEFSRSISWPATRDDIVKQLRQQNAPDFVVKQVENLPDRKYDNIGEVVKAGRGSFM